MPLQCYYPEQYEYNTSEIDGQCIAPNSEGRRCRFDISIDERNEANQCRANARVMEFGPARDWELERHVLARCCGDHHRQKLEQNVLCLQTVAQTYSDMIEDPRRWRDASGRVLRPKHASQMQFNYAGELRNHYPLQPRLIGPNGATIIRERSIPVMAPANYSPFLPYPSLPRDDIKEVIRRPATEEYRNDDKLGHGYVYALQWPSYPAFIKVGYTTISASRRAAVLATCHQGIKVAFESAMVAWPKRIERLVHLELKDVRRKIPECSSSSCRSEHYEWFETSAAIVIETISEWERLDRREPLYNHSGRLTSAWLERLQHWNESITAAELHAALDHEQEVAKQKAYAEAEKERVAREAKEHEAATQRLRDAEAEKIRAEHEERRAEAATAQGKVVEGITALQLDLMRSMQATTPAHAQWRTHADDNRQSDVAASQSHAEEDEPAPAAVAAIAAAQVIQTADAVQKVAAIALPQVAQVVVATTLAQQGEEVAAAVNSALRSSTSKASKQVSRVETVSRPARTKPRQGSIASAVIKDTVKSTEKDAPDMFSFFEDFMALLQRTSLEDRHEASSLPIDGRVLRSMVAA